MNRRQLVWSLSALLATAAFAAPPPAAAPSETSSGTTTSAQTPAGVQALLGDMDTKVDPCQDFYRYACGGWLAHTRRPADHPVWARSFSTVQEENREIVRKVLEDAAAHPGTDPDRARVGHYYASCMDTSRIDAAGAKPLAPYLAEIDRVHDLATLFATAGTLDRLGVRTLFRMSTRADSKNPRQNIAQFSQGGLGLPDRDYYVSQDPKKQAILEKYPGHVAEMLTLIGESQDAAAQHAKEIVAFETRLAEASKPRAELRDPDKNYHKIDRAGLEKLSPRLPWKAFFDATGYPAIEEINVRTPEFFEQLDAILADTSPAALREYLRWHLVHEAAPFLSEPFVEADFDFFDKRLSGQETIEPRWERCVDFTNRALGEAVGKVYIQQKFPGSSKATAQEMVRDIEAAFGSSLPGLDWMDAATREKAKEKVAALASMIGYPDTWRDYSSMTIVPDDFFANVEAASRFDFDRQAKKIGHPVDRSEWHMSPQTVNAYNNPPQNQIVFPAGILQPPFFDKDFPAAMNYGGIGAVVGHELTHGFDDQGRKFDAEGSLREWWSPAVAAKFEARAQCVRDQYSSYQVEPGVHVNGKLTAGENIADIGGLKEAYLAFQSYQERHGEKREIPELTNDQLFFVAYAQNWCSLVTPEAQRMRVTVNPHSPAEFRAIGAVSDNPDFAKAFGCKVGDPMVPKNQCVVW